MTLLYSAGSYHPWVRKEVYSGLLPKPLVWVHGHQRQHDWDRYPHLGLTQTSLISSYWSCRGPETSLLQWACVLINCILWMLGQTPQSLHRTGPMGKSLLFCRLVNVQGSEGHCVSVAAWRHHQGGPWSFTGTDIASFPTSRCVILALLPISITKWWWLKEALTMIFLLKQN